MTTTMSQRSVTITESGGGDVVTKEGTRRVYYRSHFREMRGPRMRSHQDFLLRRELPIIAGVYDPLFDVFIISIADLIVVEKFAAFLFFSRPQSMV